MRPLPAAALSAVAVVLAASSGFSSARVCELGRVDRAHVDSSKCLSCHDGSVAPLVHASIPSASFETLSAPAGQAQGSHPVEVDYFAASARRPALFKAVGALPQGLVLSDGKVTCGTCHDIRSGREHYVAVSMDHSAMCTSCHAY